MPTIIRHDDLLGSALGSLSGGFIDQANQISDEDRQLANRKDYAAFTEGLAEKRSQSAFDRSAGYTDAQQNQRQRLWETKIAPELDASTPDHVSRALFPLMGAKFAKQGHLDPHDLDILGSQTEDQYQRSIQAADKEHARQQAATDKQGTLDDAAEAIGSAAEAQGYSRDDPQVQLAIAAARGGKVKPTDAAIRPLTGMYTPQDAQGQQRADEMATHNQNQEANAASSMDLREREFAERTRATKVKEDAVKPYLSPDEKNLLDRAKQDVSIAIVMLNKSSTTKEKAAAQQRLDQATAAYNDMVEKANKSVKSRFPNFYGHSASTTDEPVRVSTPDEASRLPRGTVFITPDGRRKVVP